MSIFSGMGLGLSLAFALTVAATPGHAYTYVNLHDFCTSSCSTDGKRPVTRVLMDGNKLYGTTSVGGTNNGGIVYRYNVNTGNYAILYNFCTTGSCPFGPDSDLIMDTSGNLYGVAGSGGANGGGSVYELVKPTLTPGWTLVTLYDFCATIVGSVCTDGYGPVSRLTYAGQAGGTDYDGTSLLFGTTSAGGTSDDGAVYALQLSGGVWSEKVIHSFAGTTSDGRGPDTNLYMDGSSNLWGTTIYGGSKDVGTAFKLTHGANLWTNAWSETILFNFCWSGAAKCPEGSLANAVTMDGSGNLIGSTSSGGSGHDPAADGIVFKLASGSCTEGGTATFWCETVLYNFCPSAGCTDGEGPIGDVVLDGSGNIFGATNVGGANANGEVYELSGSSLSVLYSFCATGGASCTDGAWPFAGPILDASGDVFGTVWKGGNANNGGVLYELTNP